MPLINGQPNRRCNVLLMLHHDRPFEAMSYWLAHSWHASNLSKTIRLIKRSIPNAFAVWMTWNSSETPCVHANYDSFIGLLDLKMHLWEWSQSQVGLRQVAFSKTSPRGLAGMALSDFAVDKASSDGPSSLEMLAVPAKHSFFASSSDPVGWVSVRTDMCSIRNVNRLLAIHLQVDDEDDDTAVDVGGDGVDVVTDRQLCC